MSERRESHEACLGDRVGGACNFMVNVMKLVNSRVRFFFAFLWMEKRSLKYFAKSIVLENDINRIIE